MSGRKIKTILPVCLLVFTMLSFLLTSCQKKPTPVIEEAFVDSVLVIPSEPPEIQLYDRGGITYLRIHGHDMLLVNKAYHIPSSYGNGITSETRTAYNAMAAAAGAAGHSIWISSGYRSYQNQADIFAYNVTKYGSAEEANKISARPGESEHQTGLALDLDSLDGSGFTAAFGTTPSGQWLAAHCAEYGFILRYPQGKIWATGYIYEPWHFRYVGVELAKILTESGLTVEEYAGLVNP